MKNIIIAFDSMQQSRGVMEFARRLNEAAPITITGVFLPPVNFDSMWSYNVGGESAAIFMPTITASDTVVIQRNIAAFEEICTKYNIRYRVHRDLYDFALPQMQIETRFADLLLMSSESFYNALGTVNQEELVKAMLHKTECPVLLVPEHFDFPETNILAYDGSRSSIYAMKQFCYLFPLLTDNRTVVAYADEDANAAIPYESNVQELLSRHFSDIAYSLLRISPKQLFSTWVSEQKAAILVSGSFGRSRASQFFSKSFVLDVIRDHQIPVFIAHN